LYFRRLQKSYSAIGLLFKVLSSGTPSWGYLEFVYSLSGQVREGKRYGKGIGDDALRSFRYTTGFVAAGGLGAK
jgi:hypothetical protein